MLFSIYNWTYHLLTNPYSTKRFLNNTIIKVTIIGEISTPPRLGRKDLMRLNKGSVRRQEAWYRICIILLWLFITLRDMSQLKITLITIRIKYSQRILSIKLKKEYIFYLLLFVIKLFNKQIYSRFINCKNHQISMMSSSDL